MQTSVDKFGRVLIPKKIRDHLGMKPGTAIQILEHDHEVLLKLINHKVPLQRKNGVLIFTGEATKDLESFIQKERENHLKNLY